MLVLPEPFTGVLPAEPFRPIPRRVGPLSGCVACAQGSKVGTPFLAKSVEPLPAREVAARLRAEARERLAGVVELEPPIDIERRPMCSHAPCAPRSRNTP
jgi:hypothetical protein